MLATPKCHAKHSLKANWVFQISATCAYNVVLSLQLGKLASKENAKSIQEDVYPASEKQSKGGPGLVGCTLYVTQQGSWKGSKREKGSITLVLPSLCSARDCVWAAPWLLGSRLYKAGSFHLCASWEPFQSHLTGRHLLTGPVGGTSLLLNPREQ